jgi:hypothetical protein
LIHLHLNEFKENSQLFPIIDFLLACMIESFCSS